MDDNGKYCNDATDGKTSGIAHKHACRVAVVPEKSDTAAADGKGENHRFFNTADIGQIEVIGEDFVLVGFKESEWSKGFSASGFPAHRAGT